MLVNSEIKRAARCFKTTPQKLLNTSESHDAWVDALGALRSSIGVQGGREAARRAHEHGSLGPGTYAPLQSLTIISRSVSVSTCTGFETLFAFVY